MECTQQLAFRFQEEQLPHQQWAHRHHVRCFAAQCVVPSLKQAVAACQRAWQGGLSLSFFGSILLCLKCVNV